MSMLQVIKTVYTKRQTSSKLHPWYPPALRNKSSLSSSRRAKVCLSSLCTSRREEGRCACLGSWTGWSPSGMKRLLLNCLLGVLDLRVGLMEIPWTLGPGRVGSVFWLHH